MLERLMRWFAQRLCSHGYAWIDPTTGASGCHWCGREWEPDDRTAELYRRIAEMREEWEPCA